jgi:UDP-glucose 4-epimerase
MERTALVTGGAGFIGSHVVEALVQRGWRVRVLDNLSSGAEANLASIGGTCELIVGDIRDEECVRHACTGVDTVFHLAAFISVPGSVDDPKTADGVNIVGTLNVLLAARDAGVRRLVFSSSAAVYGEPETLPTPETYLPSPGSPYGLEKLYGEHMCRLFTTLYGLETVALRYFNVFGPRQNPASEYAAVIPKFADTLLRGQTPTIFGDGCQTRDFLFVGDVARANLLAATEPRAAGRVMNIASGRSVSILELFHVLQNLCGLDVVPRMETPRPGDVRQSLADVRLAEDLLGFRASVSLEDGLQRTVAWMRARR